MDKSRSAHGPGYSSHELAQPLAARSLRGAKPFLRARRISSIRVNLEESSVNATPTRRTLLCAAPALLALTSAAMAQGSGAPLRVFRAPGCTCCEGWAQHLRREGFDVMLEDAPDLDAARRAAGVPEDLAGCHTGLLGSRAVIEGHVPAVAIRRFLADQGRWWGLAVPGMPLGSPGMEVPGRTPESYNVFAFASDGQRARFMAVRGDQAI